MKFITVFLFWLQLPAWCWASTPASYSGYCELLDRVFVATAAPSSGAVALHILEAVAEDRRESVRGKGEALAGLQPGQIQRKEFADPMVRACALWRIGQVELPEALAFLRALKPLEVGVDMNQQVWPAAQVALRSALLRRISDPQLRVEFLEKTSLETLDPAANSSVNGWAIDQLCNGGFSQALPTIYAAIRRRGNGRRDEEDIEFCEEQIRVLSRVSDRVSALATALNPDSDEGDRIIMWAIYELDKVRSARADAVLRSFADQIGKLPEGFPSRERWSTFKSAIDGIWRGRRR